MIRSAARDSGSSFAWEHCHQMYSQIVSTREIGMRVVKTFHLSLFISVSISNSDRHATLSGIDYATE